MKKIFVEPKIKKIELNMNENIASSTGEVKYVFNVRMEALCVLQGSDFNILHVLNNLVPDYVLSGCSESSFARRGGATYVTREEMMNYK